MGGTGGLGACGAGWDVRLLGCEWRGDAASRVWYVELAEQREGKGRMELAHTRVGYDEFVARASGTGIALAECVFDEMGKSCTIERAMEEIDRRNAHGALDSIEGAVWRVERVSKEGAWEVDFLAKFVRHGKVDGKYLPEISGEGEVWNWRPGKGVA